MYKSRSKVRMRLHAGQLEDVPAGTQRGCDVPKTSFAVGVNPYILRMFKGTFLACRPCHKFNLVDSYLSLLNSNI